MSSGRSATATVLHLLAAGIMAWGYMSLEQTVMHSTIIEQKGGHLQFLTIQALAVSWFTMVLSLAYDFVPSKFFRNAKRAFFMIALPLSFVVTSIYWSLITFFPYLIVPPAPEKNEPATPSFAQYPDGLARIPLSLDLALHLTPALTLLVDFFLFEESYGKAEAAWGATAMSALFGVWYASWVEYCASFNGTFPYPFLTLNPFPIRVAIYTVVTAIAFVSFRVINAVHSRVWGRTKFESKSRIEKTE
ncbi:hypothetical protein ACEPAI_5128 [Sanghuangporus weigelae]